MCVVLLCGVLRACVLLLVVDIGHRWSQPTRLSALLAVLQPNKRARAVSGSSADLDPIRIMTMPHRVLRRCYCLISGMLGVCRAPEVMLALAIRL